MRLTGYEFLQLQQALLSAFPSPASLAQMVRVRFDLNLVLNDTPQVDLQLF